MGTRQRALNLPMRAAVSAVCRAPPRAFLAHSSRGAVRLFSVGRAVTPRSAAAALQQRWHAAPAVCTTRGCASEAKAPNPKIDALVEQIASLSLLEASELTEALKEKLGISNAMLMPAGGGGGAAAAPEEEAAAPAAEKTHFTVKLSSFDAASKIKLIKEVRALTGLGLKEAKDIVEKVPSDLKADVKKEEAEAIKEKLEAVGGTVVLE